MTTESGNTGAAPAIIQPGPADACADGDSSNHPPKPVFALSVGVVGHRPDRLPKDKDAYDRIEAEVSRVLKEISREARVVCDRYAEFFTSGSQSRLDLSLVTALAEGADTIAAKAIVPGAYVIDTVLPFEQTNYANDFKGKALTDFENLYKSARSKLVLPGVRDLPPRNDDPAAKKAYEAAGLTVISNCDIVLTVWDGGESGGQGGTTDMLMAAGGLGVPIIHIDANGKNQTLLKWSGLDRFPVQADKLDGLPAKPFDDGLPHVMDELVRPPDTEAECKGLRRHLKEKFKSLHLYLAFPLLMLFTFVRLPAASHWRPESLKALSDKFFDLLSPLGGERTLLACIVTAHSWADAIGLHFAQVFRSAFVVNFFLAAFAVAMALLSLLTPEEWPIKVEIGLIFIVAVNTGLGQWNYWHNRWIEPREVAERLRVASMLWILGVRPRAFSGEEPAWTGWYARAMVRAQTQRTCCFDRPTIDNARAAIVNILHDQCGYHTSNARRMKRLERHLEWTGFLLFGLTVLVAIDHLFFHEALLGCLLATISGHADHAFTNRLAILLSAVLPTFATATYGIRVIGDFEGIARRSERSHESLKNYIAALRQDPPDLDVLRRRVRAAGEAMLGDLSSWRLAADSRELSIPG